MTSNQLGQSSHAIIGWFLPVELNSNADNRLKATRTVLFGFAMLFWAPVFAPIYYVLGSPRGALVIGLTAVAIVASMLFLRLTKSPELTGNLIAASVYSCLVVLAFFCGGIESASLWWLAAVPIIGLLLCGFRSGAAWAILSCVACIAYFLLAWNGISVHNDIHVQDRALLDRAALCGIVLCAATLTLTFKVGEAAARTELEDARNASEQANRAKSAFLANMSHELRTPMNGILGLTELVLRSPLQDDQRDFLRAVHESGNNLLAVLNEILDFSRIDAGKLTLEPRPFDLYENLGNALKPFGTHAHTKGLELICRIGRGVPQFVVGDSVRLRQLVTNLVGNALKFTEAGEILVGVQCQSRDGEKVVLHFTMTDTGIGIPPEKQSIIFRAFEQADGTTTRRYGGTGLGLAICSQLVALMEGQIYVESEPGRGSTFHLTIPFVVENGPSPDPHTIDLTRFQGVRILIVDDNASSLSCIEAIVKDWKMLPDCASECDSAMEMISAAAAKGEPYRLVLIDSQMPKTDGFELAAQLQKERGSGCSTIMMLTSDNYCSDLSRCETLGITACVTKPLKQSELRDAFAAALRYRADKTPGHLLPGHEQAARCKQLRILVVEDSLVNQKLIVGLLERQGSQVTVANNGLEALSVLQSKEFDLVLMDIQMPEMDGLEATTEVRRQEHVTGKHLPIIAVTAHAMKGDRERCLDAGMDEYVSKPIRSEQLFDMIDCVLHKRDPAQSERIAIADVGTTTIDWNEALQSVQHDREILDTLVEAVLQEAPVMMETVRRAIRDLEAETLRIAAHTLKGSLRYFGVQSVYEQAFELERMGRDGRFDAAEEKSERLSRDLQEVLQQLGEYVKSGPAN